MSNALVFWVLQLGLLILAIILTIRASKEKAIGKKIVIFFGVAISTMPIIGLIQAAISARLKHKLYSQSCAFQALGGAGYFVLIKHILHLI